MSPSQAQNTATTAASPGWRARFARRTSTRVSLALPRRVGILGDVPAPRLYSASQAVRRVVGLDTEVRLREWTVWLPDLDPRHDGIRIGHISDVHVGVVTPDQRIRNAVELIAASEPDLVLLT